LRRRQAARREEGRQQQRLQGGVVAVDFGCGAGKWLGALASRCDLVVGIDISAELLQLASAACSTAVLLQRDLGERWPLVVGAGGAGAAMRVEGGVWPRADLAVCANVIMSPGPLTCRIQLENLSASLRPGGALLLVVPAADSIQVVKKRQHDWIKACAERGLAMEELDPSELGEVSESNGGRGGGVYPRLGVLQKHWRRDEIISAVASVSLQVTTLEMHATTHRLRSLSMAGCSILRSQKYSWENLVACVSRWRRSSLWSTPGGQSSLARRMKRSGSILGLWRRARAWGCVRLHLTNRCHSFLEPFGPFL
jgi:SAM-dependent methyltransferase